MKLARKRASNGDVRAREALKACDPLSRAIEATGGRRPCGMQEIIDAICAFLSDAYFGNHLQLAVGRTLEPFARVVPNFVRIADLPATESDCPPSPSPPLPAAPAPNGAPQTSDGNSWVHHVFSSLGVTLGGAFSSAQQMRLGAATHGAEFFLGNETSNRGAVRVAAPLAHHGTATIGGGFTGEIGFERRCKNSDGLIFRVERQHGPVDDEYRSNDALVRASAARLARGILESGTSEPGRGGNGKPRLDALIEALVQGDPPFDLNLLSIQQSKRSSISTSGGGGGGGGLRVTGDTQICTRLGMFAGVAVGGKLTSSSGSQAEDDVSRFSVNSERESNWGAQVEAKASASVIFQGFDRKVTVPIADLASAGAEGSDRGVVVKVRVPRRHGEIVPEKTFLDVETGSLAAFKGLVDHELEAWTKTRDATRGLDIDEFFDWADKARHDDHLYYLRKRLHPDVARRVNELASLQKVLPDDSARKGELSAETKRLVADPRAWVPASLIIYQKEARTQEIGVRRVPLAADWFRVPSMLLANLFRAKESRYLESEREICFHTGGWSGLHALEQTPEVKEKIARLLRNEAESPPEVGSDALAELQSEPTLESELSEVVVVPGTPSKSSGAPGSVSIPPVFTRREDAEAAVNRSGATLRGGVGNWASAASLPAPPARSAAGTGAEAAPTHSTNGFAPRW